MFPTLNGSLISSIKKILKGVFVNWLLTRNHLFCPGKHMDMVSVSATKAKS